MVAAIGVSVSPGGQSQAIQSDLRILPAPSNLSVYAARRAAAIMVDELVAYSDTQTTALGLGDHVTAVASHAAILDRPRHETVSITLGVEDSVTGLRRRYGLSARELAALNPDVTISSAGEGDELTFWVYDPANPPRSLHRPNRGRLTNGEIFPPGEGWIVANEDRAFAASQLIDGLIHAMRVTMAEHPGGQELLIADVSRARGGRLSPHRSHQSGRDVDITYYRRTSDTPTFTRTRADELDEKRTWTFLRTLLTEHDIVWIFMSRYLQVRLYEYAESVGEHPAWLASVFQYGSRGHRNNHGTIRTAPGHHDHMHIRFACSPTDVRCRSTH